MNTISLTAKIFCDFSITKQSCDPSSDSLLAEVFLEFFSAGRQMPGDLCTVSGIISLSLLSLETDVKLWASGLWLATRTGTGRIATLA